MKSTITILTITILLLSLPIDVQSRRRQQPKKELDEESRTIKRKLNRITKSFWNILGVKEGFKNKDCSKEEYKEADKALKDMEFTTQKFSTSLFGYYVRISPFMFYSSDEAFCESRGYSSDEIHEICSSLLGDRLEKTKKVKKIVSENGDYNRKMRDLNKMIEQLETEYKKWKKEGVEENGEIFNYFLDARDNGQVIKSFLSRPLVNTAKALSKCITYDEFFEFNFGTFDKIEKGKIFETLVKKGLELLDEHYYTSIYSQVSNSGFDEQLYGRILGEAVLASLTKLKDGKKFLGIFKKK